MTANQDRPAPPRTTAEERANRVMLTAFDSERDEALMRTGSCNTSAGYRAYMATEIRAAETAAAQAAREEAEAKWRSWACDEEGKGWASWKSRAQQAEAALEEARAVLADVEWHGERWKCNPNNERTCPACHARWTAAGQHYADCPLKAALRPAPVAPAGGEKEREAVAATARRKIEKLRGIAEARASREATAAAYAKAWHDLATCANDLADGENGGAFVALLDAFLEAWLSARGRAGEAK